MKCHTSFFSVGQRVICEPWMFPMFLMSSMPNTLTDANGNHDLSIPSSTQIHYLGHNGDDANLPNQIPLL